MGGNSGGGGRGGRSGGGGGGEMSKNGDAGQPGEVVRQANQAKTYEEARAQIAILDKEIATTESAMRSARDSGVSYADRKLHRDLIDSLEKKRSEIDVASRRLPQHFKLPK
jgi:hypothetical protein